MKKKTAAFILSAVLLFGAAIGGTYAWLTAVTAPVVNTFTSGKVSITLTETAGTQGSDANHRNFKMLPGDVLAKDPVVTVKAGSEASYVFVKVQHDALLDAVLTYSVRTGQGKWTQLPNVADVYYTTVPATTTDKTLYILTGSAAHANGQVTVKDTANATNLAAANGKTLTFTAYAIQQSGQANVAAAWNQVKDLH